MDHDRLIQQSLDYIDRHIKEELDADALGRLAGFSPAHFARVFSARLGVSVGDYIRRRRLLYALHELRMGGRVIDVAMEYGFDTHAGFTRAVRRYFGCPPSVLRLHFPSGPPSPVTLPLPGPDRAGLPVKPLFVQRESMKLAGYDMRSVLGDDATVEDVRRFWLALRESGRDKRLSALTGQGLYGVSVGEWPGEDYTFLIGVRVEDFETAAGELRRFVVPGCECAVFRTQKEEPARLPDAIARLWRHIIEDWLPGSGCVFDYQLSDMEAYGGDLFTVGEDSRIDADIYVPIRRKEEK